MTRSLRKATLALALLGGSALAVAMPGIANAGAPDGYFSNSYRYFGPALPPPAYAEIIPVYPAPVYPAPAPAICRARADLSGPAYTTPLYEPPAVRRLRGRVRYGYDPGLEYVRPTARSTSASNKRSAALLLAEQGEIDDVEPAEKAVDDRPQDRLVVDVGEWRSQARCRS